MAEAVEASDQEMMRLHREVCDQLARDDAALARDQIAMLNTFRSAMAAAAAQFRERQKWHPLEREIVDLDDRLAELGVPNTPFVP